VITSIRDDRLIVISDMHLGSFFCHPQQALARFFEFACAGGYNICINGDGIDVIHTSVANIVRETSQLLARIRQVMGEDTTVYYTIGNHDVILEQYLHTWGSLRLVPFLNVQSGDTRIRIEHGHLYDSFFMNHPELQERMTRATTYLLKLYPPWYHWHRLPRILKHRSTTLPLVGPYFKRKFEPEDGLRIPGQRPAFIRGADELGRRGFDVVIFGHTHQAGQYRLSGGRTYMNTGSWFRDPHYVTIESGVVTLQPWDMSPPRPPAVSG